MEINHKRKWTMDDMMYLEEKAGNVALSIIARNLGRTEKAVREKCIRNKIPLVRNAVLLQLSDVARIVGTDNKTVSVWCSKYGLPMQRKALNYAKRPFVEFKSLVKWLENNQNRWHSDNMELHALGEEFDWLKRKRMNDAKRLDKNRKKPWNDAECESVYKMLRDGKGWQEIAFILGRPNRPKTIQAALYRYQNKKKKPVDK